MSSDDTLNATLLVLMMILPLSALMARRIPLKKAAGLAAIWAAVLVAGVLIVGLTRDGVAASWEQLKTVMGNDEQRITGDAIRLRMASDGHFWANVRINGIPVHMLVDSGATVTSLSMETAKAAGLDLDQNPIPVQIMTANGAVMARTSSIDRLTIGPIVAKDLRVDVAEEFGTTNVLGMNFLSRLKSWRVENGWLILEPKHS
jgi:aspartyl protease family protein